MQSPFRSPAHALRCDANDRLDQVAKRMADMAVDFAIVQRNGKPAGIVTERQIAVRTRSRQGMRLTAGQVMTFRARFGAA